MTRLQGHIPSLTWTAFNLAYCLNIFDLVKKGKQECV